jgi:hypothetical protein
MSSNTVGIIALVAIVLSVIGILIYLNRQVSRAVDHRGTVPRYPALYFITLAALGIGYILLGMYFSDVTFFSGFAELNVGHWIWFAGIIHFAAGVRIVDIQHLVGVYFVGIPTIQISGGFIVAPPGIFQQTSDELRTYEDEFPDEPQNVWHGDDTLAPMPAGKVPPIRVAFSDPQTDYPFGITGGTIRAGDPLNRRTTNEVSFVVRWRILDEFNFRRNIQLPENARAQLDDIGVSFLNENLTRMTPAVALLNMEIINAKFEEILRTETANWGVSIVNGRIKLIGLSHGLNSSIQDIAQGEAEAQAVALTAGGEKIRLQREGEGRADAEYAEITRRGEAQAKMASDLGLGGADILAAETARAIGSAPSTKLIVGTDGMTQILAAGAAIAESFKTPPAAPPPAPPATP